MDIKNNKLVRQYTKQPLKFRTKIWVEINDDSRGTYNTKLNLRLQS